MVKKGRQEDAIWIVDDDKEDQELMADIFKELNLPNSVEFFNDGPGLLKKLDEVDVAPFIIISDVNLPKMNGFELRENLLKSSNNKFHSVPFIFWSSKASEAQIRKAYQLSVHGFFIKEPRYQDWKTSLMNIIQYWRKSQTPSKEDKPDSPQL